MRMKNLFVIFVHVIMAIVIIDSGGSAAAEKSGLDDDGLLFVECNESCPGGAVDLFTDCLDKAFAKVVYFGGDRRRDLHEEEEEEGPFFLDTMSADKISHHDDFLRNLQAGGGGCDVRDECLRLYPGQDHICCLLAYECDTCGVGSCTGTCSPGRRLDNNLRRELKNFSGIAQSCTSKFKNHCEGKEATCTVTILDKTYDELFYEIGEAQKAHPDLFEGGGYLIALPLSD